MKCAFACQPHGTEFGKIPTIRERDRVGRHSRTGDLYDRTIPGQLTRLLHRRENYGRRTVRNR